MTQYSGDLDTARAARKPAIGIVATNNSDEVARVIVRARARGHEVIVFYRNIHNSFLPELSDITGVHVLTVENTTRERPDDAEFARQQLEIAARTMSANGLIIVDDVSTYVDFQESLARFDAERYVCEAVPQRATDVNTLVAIPAYNEAGTIEMVVKEAMNYADDVLVVDDGSSDQTAVIAEEAGATVISHDRNRGYGAALKTIFETAARLDVTSLVIIDGDGQHEVDDVPKLISSLEKGSANVVIGSRFVGSSKNSIPLYRLFGLVIVNIMSNVSLGTITSRSRISDTQSGFRAYDHAAIDVMADANISDKMDASLDILYQVKEHKLTTKEIPITVNYDVDDGHSQNPLFHGIRLVSSILGTVERKHPMKAVGIPGFLLTFFGFGFGYLTVTNYVTTETFSMELALGSGFFILLGTFLGFTAIVLHSLKTHADSL